MLYEEEGGKGKGPLVEEWEVLGSGGRENVADGERGGGGGCWGVCRLVFLRWVGREGCFGAVGVLARVERGL